MEQFYHSDCIVHWTKCFAVRQSIRCMLEFVYLFTLIMLLCSQIIHILTVPGKVITMHESMSCPNGGQAHAESQKENSISLINLVHLAPLLSLI